MKKMTCTDETNHLQFQINILQQALKEVNSYKLNIDNERKRLKTIVWIKQLRSLQPRCKQTHWTDVSFVRADLNAFLSVTAIQSKNFNSIFFFEE